MEKFLNEGRVVELWGKVKGLVEANAPVGLAYGICATAGSTVDKVVDVPGFMLAAGARVAVTFTYSVPANATLNVGGTGAKRIQWQGMNMLGGIIDKGVTVELVYTGDDWCLLSVDKVGVGSDAFTDASWERIDTIAREGQASSVWSRGDEKIVALSTGEQIVLRIEDFDHDMLKNGGKAAVSLMTLGCLTTDKKMNTKDNNVGGWGSTELRTWLNGTVKRQLPAGLQGVIKPVNKLTSAGGGSSAITTTSDDIWLPSFTEMGFSHDDSYSPGGEGTPYPLFIGDSSRIKRVNGSAVPWWTRSPRTGDNYSFCCVNNDGSENCRSGIFNLFVPVGFCI